MIINFVCQRQHEEKWCGTIVIITHITLNVKQIFHKSDYYKDCTRVQWLLKIKPIIESNSVQCTFIHLTNHIRTSSRQFFFL